MLNALLNKGGAGISISRQETAERLDPLLRQLIGLRRHYEELIRRTPDPEVAEKLEDLLKYARTDVAKLSETIHSAGGQAYTGVDLRDEPLSAGETNDDTSHLRNLEKEFLDAIEGESRIKHHIRTGAILKNVKDNGSRRLSYLDEINRKPVSHK